MGIPHNPYCLNNCVSTVSFVGIPLNPYCLDSGNDCVPTVSFFTPARVQDIAYHKQGSGVALLVVRRRVTMLHRQVRMTVYPLCHL